MDNNAKLKLGVIAVFILVGLASLLYLVYGLTLIWQGMAAGVTIGFLLVLLFLVTVLAIYFWTRMFLIKRKLSKCQERLEELERRLKSDKAVERSEEDS